MVVKGLNDCDDNSIKFPRYGQVKVTLNVNKWTDHCKALAILPKTIKTKTTGIGTIIKIFSSHFFLVLVIPALVIFILAV
jgi:hypothetical protein